MALYIKKHPKMWYNLGRWSMYMNNPEVDMLHICECTHEAVLQLGTIAYTNMNKMRGNSSSGAEYWNLATHPLSGEILRAELEILQPRVIVCCGTYDVFKHHFPDYEGIVISMPHPGAFKATMSMLQSLDEQYKKQV